MKSGLKTVSLSLLVMALWGSLYPMVKIGYNAFDINSSSVPDILMFAGVRFVICGLIVCAYCLIKKEKIATPKGENIFRIQYLLAFVLISVGIVLGNRSEA